MPLNHRLILPVFLSATSVLPAAEPDFYRDVYPFLKANCISCHNKTTTKADLNMETPEDMKKGGESGPGIIPGKGAESLIVLASLHKEDMEMPPQNNKSGAVKLSPTEIEVLKSWIDLGAKSSVQQERQVVWQALAAGVHPIYSVAMTKDGRYAACGRSNQIFVYDLATRQFVAQISDPAEKNGAHRAMVQSLAFSPDGTRLASGSFREVKIWRLDTTKAGMTSGKIAPAVDAEVVKKIAAQGKVPVHCQAASSDGKQIVTGSADGVVRVWDAATLKSVKDLTGSLAASRKLADLEWRIAAAALEQAFQKTEVTRIEAQNKALEELLKKANEAIAAMKKVLPEKQKAVAPAAEARTAAEKAVEEIAAKTAAPAAGKPDAAIESELKKAQDKLLTARMAETSAVAAVAAAENNVKDAEADMKRITASKEQNARALTAASAAIEAAGAAQSAANAELAAIKTSITKNTAKPAAVAFSPDGKRVAAVFDDGWLRVWAVATGLPIEERGGEMAGSTALVAAADGTFTATKTLVLSTGTTPGWVLERTIDGGVFADRVNAVSFSPDGKVLATGGGELSRSGDIHLFEAATGKLLKTWKERHEDAVLSVDFSPDGKLLASGAADKLARVTDIASGRPVNLFEGHTHHVTGVAFRADGRVLATGGADGTVITWNMILGERKKKIEGWSKEVTSVQYIGATNQIVTSAGDNLIKIVNDDGAEVRSIAQLPDFMQAAAATFNGGIIIGGGEDSILRVWDGTNGKEMAAFDDK